MIKHGKTSLGAKRSPRGKGQGLGMSYSWHDPMESIRRVERGLPYTLLSRFQRYSGLGLDAVSATVRIPPRTLSRRRASGKFKPDESERLLRLCIVFDKAAALFGGDVPAAKLWLTTPCKALAGLTPLSLARTEIGAREVENLILRLEHGVYS